MRTVVGKGRARAILIPAATVQADPLEEQKQQYSGSSRRAPIRPAIFFFSTGVVLAAGPGGRRWVGM